MTQPTQARIEAAARALIYEYRHPATGDGNFVGKVNALEAALTAAAEVDPLTPAVYPSTKIVIAATIERCAQRIEQDSFSHPDKTRLAAAIRALKDEKGASMGDDTQKTPQVQVTGTVGRQHD